jgi:hypothetical protein
MKAVVEINFKLWGENPGKEKIEEAILKMNEITWYAESEDLDGSSGWAIEIENIIVETHIEKHEDGQKETEHQ